MQLENLIAGKKNAVFSSNIYNFKLHMLSNTSSLYGKLGKSRDFQAFPVGHGLMLA